MIRVVAAAGILVQLGGLGWVDGADRRGLFISSGQLGLVPLLQVVDDRLNDGWLNDRWLNDRCFNWGLLGWFLVHSAFPF